MIKYLTATYNNRGRTAMTRQRESDKDYNTIYDDGVVKYTINIPHELYSKITQNARRQHLNRSVVIRACLDRAFVNERPMTMAQLLKREKESTEIIYVDPPHRYHGFTGGLRRNSFVAGWFRRRAEQYQISKVK